MRVKTARMIFLKALETHRLSPRLTPTAHTMMIEGERFRPQKKKRDDNMPPGDDIYGSMTALYSDLCNVEGTTYAKRWKRHERSQKIVMAIHGGGIEKGTSEIALAVAGYHPDTMTPSVDGLGLHDFWLFEGLLNSKNGRLHVTASNYDEPIATELVQNARRCISLHGCLDEQAKEKIQLGGLDYELRNIVLEELTAVGIPAEITTDNLLDGDRPDNIANKTKTGGCAQLEMGTSCRASLFDIDTRSDRKKTTNDQFWLLVGSLRKAMSRVQ